MNVKQVTAVVFSPTENTKEVAEVIGSQLPGAYECLDLTDLAFKRPEYHFTEDEVVVVGAPVYGGRIPRTAAERFKKLHGRSTPAVLVVTYGNRAYEDALAELKDLMEAQGFCPIAAAAVVAEHNIDRKVAAGRPDGADREKLVRFGEQVDGALRRWAGARDFKGLQLPGSHPYRAYGTVPVKVKVAASCTGCGLCIRKCPVGAISRTDPKITDEERCIGCMRCIKVCPAHSRSVSPLVLMAVHQKLKKVCQDRKEPEFFS